eukprot:207853-Alexandrium_andersonii.AAC.1
MAKTGLGSQDASRPRALLAAAIGANEPASSPHGWPTWAFACSNLVASYFGDAAYRAGVFARRA